MIVSPFWKISGDKRLVKVSHGAGKKEELGIQTLGSKAISVSVISQIRPPDSPSKL